MTPTPPAHEGPKGRKRPFYLVVALVLASIAGVTAAADGCATVGYYRGELPAVPLPDGISQADEQALRAAGERLKAALEAERGVVFPMAVGQLVLGLAMFAFATAAMAGREGARRALAQLLVVRGAMIAAEPFTMNRVRDASAELRRARVAAELRAARPPDVDAILAQQEAWERRFGRGIVLGAAAAKLAAFGLVMLALTRRRTREFYDATSRAAESE